MVVGLGRRPALLVPEDGREEGGRRLAPALLASALVVGLVVLAAACGGGTTPAPTTFSITVADAAGGSGEFQPREFTLQAGQKVTFSITNVGQAIHNMRIAGRDDTYDTADDAVSQPDVVKSGGTAVVTWIAPDKPATYRFRCDFHPQSTGTIVVE